MAKWKRHAVHNARVGVPESGVDENLAIIVVQGNHGLR